MAIDKNKQYRTRDGREVRIYETDGAGSWPVHGAKKDPEGWTACRWSEDGGFLLPHTQPYKLDLIEVKPRHQRTVWVNIYGDDMDWFAGAFPTKREADGWDKESRIACLKIDLDFEEGEGLNEAES